MFSWHWWQRPIEYKLVLVLSLDQPPGGNAHVQKLCMLESMVDFGAARVFACTALIRLYIEGQSFLCFKFKLQGRM